MRVKLKADGVYSLASVAINGVSVGSHLGGFTPFELDITDAVRSGPNTIHVNVTGASLADTLASGIRYAVHDLGGITRKIYLIVVPIVSVADAWVVTRVVPHTARIEAHSTRHTNESVSLQSRGAFDAQLSVSITLANDGSSSTSPSSPVVITVCEQAPLPAMSAASVDAWFAAGGARPLVRTCSGRPVIDTIKVSIPPFAGGSRHSFTTPFVISAAKLWTPEQPNLYTLEIETGDERTAISFGARQIKTNGSQVYLNGVFFCSCCCCR